MARVEIQEIAFRVSEVSDPSHPASDLVYVLRNGTCDVVTPGGTVPGNRLPVYQAETGTPTYTQPLALSAGRIEGWVETTDIPTGFDLIVNPANGSSYRQPVRPIRGPQGLTGETGSFPMINVKASPYNATGDGTTNDRAAIQAALDAANTAGGGTVFFPKGTYILGSALTLRSNVHLTCAGGTVLKLQNGVQSYMALGTNVSNVTIEGLIFDLNKANTTDGGADTSQMAVYLLASSAAGITKCAIRNCIIKDGHQLGLRLNATDSTFPLEVAVEGCEITGCKIGARVIRGTQIRFVRNRVYANTSEGVNFLGGKNDYVAGNRCYGNGGQGLNFSIQATDKSVGAVVVGNLCYENGADSAGNFGWGINFSVECQRFSCVGNVCRNNYQGGIVVDVFPSGISNTLYPTHGVVTGNTCSGYLGINASNGISVNGVNGLAVSGNTCEGNRNNGIFVNGRGVAVVGNTMRNNGTWGLLLNQGAAAATPAQGQHRIGPNVFEGNTSGAISELAALAGLNSYASLTTTVTA
ncbi:MAG: right-handed parallel beta-helix repeat-containing protein [Actinomycetota bacterium]|nr:right-handed parallel beta-helix repeat-containing protein [Actinomycetota bacterium]